MAMIKMIMAVIMLLILCSFMVVNEAFMGLSDKILKLPGQPTVGFQQFSGYVTLDAKKERALFYYFVEAEVDPVSKPLVLWLNGGKKMKPFSKIVKFWITFHHKVSIFKANNMLIIL